MSLTIRRTLLALMLGVSGTALAMPLTNAAPGLTSISSADEGGSNLLAGLKADVPADDTQLILASNDGHENEGSDDGEDGDEDGEGDDDDGGKVGGASAKGAFQEGCAITDVKCLQQAGQ